MLVSMFSLLYNTLFNALPTPKKYSFKMEWREITPKEANSVRSRRFRAYKRSVTNMFYVYALMLVCYVPYLAMFFVIPSTKVNSTKMLVLSYTMTLLFANSAFNPFLYCSRIREIRSEVLLTLNKFACKSE